MRNRTLLWVGAVALNLAFAPVLVAAATEEAVARWCACELGSDDNFDECCKTQADECNGCIASAE